MAEREPIADKTVDQNRLSRRAMIGTGVAFGVLASGNTIAAVAETDASCTLGFSTYGMKSLTSEQAIAELDRIGYDAVELAVRTDYDADSAMLSQERRKALRMQLADSHLKLTSLMEHVYPTDAKSQEIAVERLKLAGQVAHDLSPDAPPLIQTVLGGGEFETVKNQLRDRLGQWVRLADAAEVVIAIKPHRGGVVSKPSEAVWLIEQLGKPSRLRMVYDYSHYAYRDLPMDETIRVALPHTAHIAVKDAVQEGDRVVFRLPGESDAIDFPALIRQFHAGGYRGDINCEVSGMVSGKPGYDPIAAAETCYKNMSRAFHQSGVERLRRSR
ncbi:sugar phosphate isomerase/epimerase family protein [Stieleria varia]|uniref:Xylose isomerase-like TIM barrel n=1 Tax=Stieleria varia TaxID=2528005 RepID=A0A5C6AQB2_9BACT|nr:sugar phosphate isomerase/epimerase family protein [Stieleria varia]TWU02233.1 Xylose isomerase-like TIM barrel [Stieleria varia]